MGNFGKRPINDAAHAKPQSTYMYKGTERIDRRPYGRVERFVDPQGDVVSLQLSTPGDPKAMETATVKRMSYRANGFVEHAKCPLRHGTNLANAKIERDFAAMPAELARPCGEDKRTVIKVGAGALAEIHATDACPHIEWLISARHAKETKAQNERNQVAFAAAKRKSEADELQSIQLEMAKEQAKEFRAKRNAKPKVGE